MALIVQKFGGTSVGSIDRIRHLVEIVAKAQQAGHQVVVVVSAMAGETERLIQLSKEVVGELCPREYDILLATGEQVSAALVSMALISAQLPARSFNAHQARILTDNIHRKACILSMDTHPLLTALEAGIIPVVTGFQGVDHTGEITTIGRGGSDTTAVMLASFLKADECQIYTDVDGVYTSDPQVVKQAYRLPWITVGEMLALSSLGAKVLQATAVKLAEQHHVRVRILSSFSQGSGTIMILDEENRVKPSVSGITVDRNQAKLTVCGLPNNRQFVEDLLTAVNQASIDVDMVVQNLPPSKDRVDLSFTVPLDDYHQALSVTGQVAGLFPCCQVIGNNQIAKVSLVGVGMTSHAGVAAKMFHVLGEKGINIHLITSTEFKISTIIDKIHMERGAQILHEAFQTELVHRSCSSQCLSSN